MSEILRADDPEATDAVLDVLDDGDPVALPTDATYVLAVDPFVDNASEELFGLLRRPRDQDLPMLVGTVEQAEECVTALTDAARKLMTRLWPGPLTLVLVRHPELAADLGEDELTVGVRIPRHPLLRNLCRLGGPIAVATAIAEPGGPGLHTAQAISDAFGDAVPLVLDGGSCQGPHSTVVDATGTDALLIREGAIPWDEVLRAIKG